MKRASLLRESFGKALRSYIRPGWTWMRRGIEGEKEKRRRALDTDLVDR